MNKRIFMDVQQVFGIADKLGIYSDDQRSMIDEFYHTTKNMADDMEGRSKDSLYTAATHIKDETLDASGRLAAFDLIYHITGQRRLDIDKEAAEAALAAAMGAVVGAAAALTGADTTESLAPEYEETEDTTETDTNNTGVVTSDGAHGNAENAQVIYNELLDAGYTPVVASAFIGNFYAENDIEPGSSVTSGKGSAGLAQWLGDRKENLIIYAQNRELNPADLQTQIDYLIEEDIPANLNSQQIDMLNSMTDPSQAADYICTYFERPQNFTSQESWESCTSWKAEWDRYGKSEFKDSNYLDMEKRKEGASYWYQQFNN